MPHRFTPAEPEPLPRAPTRAQIKRHETLMHAYLVGEALREYARHLVLLSRRELADDLPCLSSPNLSDGGGARRLAENGTPRSMDELCHWIDRQAHVLSSIKGGYTRLQFELPKHAEIAWLRHVDLLTIEEIAAIKKISTRTVIRYLGVANLYLMVALRNGGGTETSRKQARKLRREAEHHEALAWADRGDVSAEEVALAGIE
ncbi:MAG: hypothetical protein ACXWQ5_00780 [Ktedonobacterales bacterium]